MFYCQLCSFVNPTFNFYLKHFKEHSSLTNKLICGFNHCNRVYSALTSLQSHVRRCHIIKPINEVSPAVIPKITLLSEGCSVESCTQKFTDKKQMMGHLKMHIDDGITIKCGFLNCKKKYNKVNSFSSHVTKIHKEKTVAQQSSNSNISTSNEGSCSTEIECDNTSVDNLLSADEHHQYYNEEKSSNVFLMNLAHFFLKLEFKFCLPASTVQYIAAELCKMNKQNGEFIKNNLLSNLKQCNISEDEITNIIDSSLKNNLFNNIEDSLATSFKRRKFNERNFPYVNPVQIALPTENGKQRFYHYVPLKETLKKLFCNRTLTHELKFHRPEINSNVFRDFTDGTVFKENKFFQQNPDALQLILYQDAFETVNPLGSAKSKYKILAVYLSIGNFPDRIRSHVNSMYLVALCKEKIFNHHKIFGKIVEDLKEIETVGIELAPNEFMKGSLVFITGDNLGSHALGGFTENFSKSQYFCRYCLVTKKSFESNDGVFKTYPERTIDSYKEVIDKLDRKRRSGIRIRKSISKKPLIIQGIKFDSAFNKLGFYHVCRPGLPPCLGHDVFEGVLAYDGKLFLDNLVDQGWFSYKLLNRRIETFNYSPEDQRDKLCSVSPKAQKLSGAACQLWSFIRLLPLLIYDKIDDIDNAVWKCTLLLSEIIEIICAPAIHETCIVHLDGLICEYIDLRKNLFPLYLLRPKHHYFKHYPELILRFGPLMKSWTLRSESKHCFMKRAVRFSRNFINITKSLSIKHELYQCFVRSGGDIISDIELKNTEKLNLGKYNQAIQQALSKFQLCNETVECHVIIKNGITYRNGDGLFISRSGYQYKIVVGKIIIILYDDIEVYFVLEMLETEFIPYLGLYKLGKVTGYKSLTFNQLISFENLHIYNTRSFSCVKPKYGLVEQSLHEL